MENKTPTPIDHTELKKLLAWKGLCLFESELDQIHNCILNEVGLSDIPDPKAWVIEAKHRFNTSEGLGYQNQKLQSEIEQLKTVIEHCNKIFADIMEYQVNNVELARTTEVYKLATSGFKTLEKSEQAKEILDLKEKAKFSEEVIRVLKEANELLKAERSAAIVELCKTTDISNNLNSKLEDLRLLIKGE